MRVVVTALGERTHLLPLVPLAWALRSAGHEVVLAVPPQLVDIAVGAGLPVVPTGTDHRMYGTLDRLSRLEGTGDELSTGMALSPADISGRSWAEWLAFYREHVGLWWRLTNDPLIPDLVALVRRWQPDLVLWEGFTWAGAVAARVCDVPHARVLSGSDLLTAAREHFLARRAEQGGGPDPLAAWLGGRLDSFGARFDESVVRGCVTVDYIPPSLRCAGAVLGETVLPVQFVPYNGRSVVPPWLRRLPVRPRVGVTLGQSSVANTGRYRVSLRDVLEGVAAHDVEVVATVPAPLQDRLEPLPPSVTLISFVPLDALAATCAAVVNHGGAATMCTTARHGVAQVVIPDDTYDERLLGGLLAEVGAGVLLEAADTTVATVSDAVGSILSAASSRRGAALLRDEIRGMPSATSVVSVLEELASGWPSVALAPVSVGGEA